MYVQKVTYIGAEMPARGLKTGEEFPRLPIELIAELIQDGYGYIYLLFVTDEELERALIEVNTKGSIRYKAYIQSKEVH